MNHRVRSVTWIAAAGLAAGLIVGCEPPEPEEEPEPPPEQQVDEEEPVEVGPEGPEQLDHAGITAVPDDPELIAEGEELFRDYGCQACHAVEPDVPSPTGPSLVGVTDRREPEWIARMILHPDEMIDMDPIAQQLLAEYATPMPDQGVEPDEAEAMVAYLGSLPGEGEEPPAGSDAPEQDDEPGDGETSSR